MHGTGQTAGSPEIPAQALLHGVRDQCRDGLFRPGSGFARRPHPSPGHPPARNCRGATRASPHKRRAGPAPRRARRDNRVQPEPSGCIAEVNLGHKEMQPRCSPRWRKAGETPSGPGSPASNLAQAGECPGIGRPHRDARPPHEIIQGPSFPASPHRRALTMMAA